MIIRRIFSFLIVLFLVFFDRNFSFSKQGTKAISFDSSIEAVSHRISNNLSDCIETERADRLINRFLAKWEVAGATVAVVKDQKLLFAKGYGFADIEKEIEVEPSHVFRVASVSKLITATAIMKLQEEGKLKLSDFVFGEHGILSDSIYSDIKDKRTRFITVEQLLRHSAGYSSKYGDQCFFRLILPKKWM